MITIDYIGGQGSEKKTKIYYIIYEQPLKYLYFIVLPSLTQRHIMHFPHFFSLEYDQAITPNDLEQKLHIQKTFKHKEEKN